MANNTYTLLGRYTVVPAADLASATAAINLRGDTRKGSAASGKRAGMEVLTVDTGVYKKYVALGAAPTDKWQLVDGSAQVTPS